MVVPSLPGYGFSDKLLQGGFGIGATADLLVNLMTKELGYERFAVHGGDIGSGVAETLALMHPHVLTGIHLTDVPYWHLFEMQGEALSEDEKTYLAAGLQWSKTEGADAMLQGNKPQTLAYGLNDSPVGLAAWIVEKFRAWSDCDGDVEERFTKDELLTNIMIYWATETIYSSFLPYYAGQHKARMGAGSRVSVPTGVALFPKDLIPAPREFAERFFNIQHWTEMPRGGHFAALEEQGLLTEDLRSFFRALR